MAGSLKYFKYTTDLGETFAILADESNIENIVVSDAGVDIGLADIGNIPYTVPGNVKPRYARYISTTTSRVRRIVVPTQAIAQALVSGDSLVALRTFSDVELGETFQFQGLTPERIRPVVIYQDTGLDDGDAGDET